MRPIILSCFYILSVPAFAGWVSGGGGGKPNDETNPWFLVNTKTVRYCVLVDERGISQPARRVRQMVTNAFSFWQDQLAEAAYQNYEDVDLRLGTQDFVEFPCRATIAGSLRDFDIVFQFGALSARQRLFFGAKADSIAETVRTAYNTEQLRAKGFIYVSADQGPRAYSSPGFVERGWSVGDGALLRNIIAHEVGHVFGIPHYGRRLGSNLMAAGYPSLIMLEWLAEFFGRFPVPNVFRISGVSNDPFTGGPRCDAGMQRVLGYFGIELPCGALRFVGNTLYLKGHRQADGPSLAEREVLFNNSPNVARIEPRVLVHLTPAQKVFPLGNPHIYYESGYLASAAEKMLRRTSAFQENRRAKPIFINLSPNGIELGGVENGLVKFNLAAD